MRLSQYLVRVMALIMACLTGIMVAGTYSIVCEQFQQPEIPEEVCIPSDPTEIAVNTPVLAETEPADHQSLPASIVTNDPEETDAGVDHTSDYYLADETPPKAFKKFEFISLETANYNVPYDSLHYGEAIIPRGYVSVESRNYKFKYIAVGSTELAFETETKRGIRYKFTGKFPSKSQYSCNLEKEYPADLTGRLTKVKDGKVIARISASFYVPG